MLLGQFNLSALLVLGAGAAIALWTGGIPTVTVPELSGFATLSMGAMTPTALEATGAQLAMTVGNAAVATSLLLEDYFDRHVEPDALATSMGTMNLVSIPLGGMPMCHGSGGVAGKYAFGARTEGANLLLGSLYLLAATVAVGIVAAYPLSMLGVILVLVALQLGQTSLQATHLPLVVAIGVVGLVVNIGVAFVAGVVVWVLLDRR
jgi:MFS superfamily sulfate permease-like transporter